MARVVADAVAEGPLLVLADAVGDGAMLLVCDVLLLVDALAAVGVLLPPPQAVRDKTSTAAAARRGDIMRQMVTHVKVRSSTFDPLPSASPETAVIGAVRNDDKWTEQILWCILGDEAGTCPQCSYGNQPRLEGNLQAAMTIAVPRTHALSFSRLLREVAPPIVSVSRETYSLPGLRSSVTVGVLVAVLHPIRARARDWGGEVVLRPSRRRYAREGC